MDETQSPVRSAAVLYERAAKALNKFRPVFLLVLRLYIGYQAAKAGLNHFRYFGKTADYFASLHIPMPKINVAIAASTEVVGGILIAMGFLTRLVAIPFTFNFVVAILAANLGDPQSHDKILHFWSNQDIILKDDAFPFLFVGLLMIFFGPGCISVDGWLKEKILPRQRK
jgi:putative oxidoreductase